MGDSIYIPCEMCKKPFYTVNMNFHFCEKCRKIRGNTYARERYRKLHNLDKSRYRV